MPQLDRSGGSNIALSGGTPPGIAGGFVGPHEFDPGAGFVPPDSCGAIGPSHFVSTVNENLSVYVKSTGARVVNVALSSFFGTSVGDTHVAFDPFSQRFIVLGSDFTTGVHLAVSSSSDPTGSWFKTSINEAQGADAGKWPDYPTLGVDANGIYTAAYLDGGQNLLSFFAIDKAPLVAPIQSLGTVTAFRLLPWEGAIQPCVTYGSPVGEYMVSTASGSQLRLRRLDPPLSAPTLTELGFVNIQSWSGPPAAPNMGSTALLDTLDGRLINAVYRNGSLWTAHCVNVSGRAGCHWYQVDPSPLSLTQSGTISDPSLYYFFPGISVNSNNEVVIGFSGSSTTTFAGAYVSGRRPSDPPGATATPQLLKAGEGAYNDGGNPSRWGDFSLTSVDPVDDLTFWTIQEYARAGNTWGTWIGKLKYDCPNPTSFCIAAPNSFSPTGATMSFTGANSISVNNFVLVASNVPPNKTGLYFYGQDQTALAPFGNGYRCINSPIFRLPVIQSDLFGSVIWSLDITNLPAGGQIAAGQSWGFQCWYRDPAAGGANFNASDGLSTVWCP